MDWAAKGHLRKIGGNGNTWSCAHLGKMMMMILHTLAPRRGKQIFVKICFYIFPFVYLCPIRDSWNEKLFGPHPDEENRFRKHIFLYIVSLLQFSRVHLSGSGNTQLDYALLWRDLIWVELMAGKQLSVTIASAHMLTHHLLILPAPCKQEHLARCIALTQGEFVALGESGASGAGGEFRWIGRF